MKTVYSALAFIINSHPALVTCMLVLLFLAACLGATGAETATGSDTYMDKDTHTGVIMDKYENLFESDSITLIVESNDVIHPEVLEYMWNLEEDIRDEPYVTSVSGLADTLKALNGGNVPVSMDESRSAVDAMPASSQLKTRMMALIQVKYEQNIPESTGKDLVANLQSLITASDPPAGVQVTESGNLVFHYEKNSAIGKSTGILICLAMILMVIAMGFLFSHVRYRFLPVVVVAWGIAVTLGIMGFTGISFSMVVIAAFPVMIGIGIDYGVQFQSRLDEECRRLTLAEAVKETITTLGPSLLIAMCTTSLGFIALLISPFPMVADFGLICVIGVASCYCAGLLIVPTCAVLTKYTPKEMPGKKRGRSFFEKYNIFLGNTAKKIAKHPVPILLLLGFIACAGIQLDGTLPINTDEDAMFPPDMEAKQSIDKVARMSGLTQSIPLYVECGDLTDPATMQWLYDFGIYETDKYTQINSADSIATIIAGYNNGKIPATDEEISALIEQLPEETTSAYIRDKMTAVIYFHPIDMEIEEIQSLITQMRNDINWYQAPPGTSSYITGLMPMFADLSTSLAEVKNVMTAIAFGLIFFFLLLVYRKFFAISAIVPVVMAVGWNGMVMYLCGLDYILLTATLGAMTIGVASEYTVLLMERFIEERGKGYDHYTAIRQSVRQIGTAVTISGMTTLFGFSALLLSSFPIISNFGLVTVAAVGFSLAGAIIVMPAVIAVMVRSN